MMAKEAQFASLEIGTLDPFIPDNDFNPERESVVVLLDNDETIIATYAQREALSKLGEITVASYWLDVDYMPDTVQAEFEGALLPRPGFNGISIAQRYPGHDPLEGRVRLRLESSKFWGSFITEGKAIGISVTDSPVKTTLTGSATHEEGVSPAMYSRF
jgi:hypothetical protein